MKIIDIKIYKAKKERREQEAQLKNELRSMEKVQLLKELLDYNDNYRKAPMDMELTIRMQLVMEVLEERAELKELRQLSTEFSAKLKSRLREQVYANQ